MSAQRWESCAIRKEVSYAGICAIYLITDSKRLYAAVAILVYLRVLWDER
jgi:hypothetical protein